MLPDAQLGAFCQALAAGKTAKEAACEAGVPAEEAGRVGRTWARRKSIRIRVATLRAEAPNNIEAFAHAYWREVFDRFFFDIRRFYGSDGRLDLSALTPRELELIAPLRVHVSRTFHAGRKRTVIVIELRGLKTPVVWAAVGKWLAAHRVLEGR